MYHNGDKDARISHDLSQIKEITEQDSSQVNSNQASSIQSDKREKQMPLQQESNNL